MSSYILLGGYPYPQPVMLCSFAILLYLNIHNGLVSCLADCGEDVMNVVA